MFFKKVNRALGKVQKILQNQMQQTALVRSQKLS